jgi:hypothetical protein
MKTLQELAQFCIVLQGCTERRVLLRQILDFNT